MTSPDPPAIVRQDVALAPLTTLGVGGNARFLAEVRAVSELSEVLSWARSRSLPVFVLGGGSNVVISDGGFSGLVLKIGIRGMEFGDGGRVMVAAGESWDGFVDSCVERNLEGVECLAGIPGCVGAAPIQNVGAYGQDVSGTIVEVEAVSRATGAPRTFTKDECRFGYRDSVFKRAERDRWIVTSVRFALREGQAPSIRYAELEKALAHFGRPSLADVRDAVLDLRRSKGMVIDPADLDTRSAGSFFMNPVVDDEGFESVAQKAGRMGIAREAIPRYSAGEMTKLSAAWLIERSGFPRGTSRGAVGLSSKHALAIVNRGGATAHAVQEFAEELRRGVRKTFGVDLEPEAAFVGS